MGWIMNIYIVNPGDTVSSIAEVTGAAEEELVYINQIAYPYLLAPGQALLRRLWKGDAQMPTGERLSWQVMRILLSMKRPSQRR